MSTTMISALLIRPISISIVPKKPKLANIGRYCIGSFESLHHCTGNFVPVIHFLIAIKILTAMQETSKSTSVTTVVNGLIRNVGGLYACRLVLGACEGGLFPSLNMYLTMVYERDEIAKRTSYLVSCMALSGAFGGLLAYGLLQMDGVGGYAGWRWVYLIEGAFSIICAFAVWFGLPSDGRNAYFLSDEERVIMDTRHQERLDYMGSNELDWNEVKLAFLDPKTWLSAWTQFCQNILTDGLGTFLPSILHAMGHGTLASNYLKIPVYCFGALAFFTFAFLSDKYGKCGMVSAVGYVILIVFSNSAVEYFACFVCIIAVYNGTGLNLAWLNVNTAPQYRRATAIEIQQTVGNTAGAVADQIYRTVTECLIVIHWLFLRRLDKEKQVILAGTGLDTRKQRTGDRDVEFMHRL
ncbi:major facilitator superfamily transporter [Colletotrichum lupini]|uniref:Major facilitator superfamily transporter n=1 Tax=Colletotrichum lupini TaxID=145971 RepID=A0A9Q8WPE6_9PEZI|nr:major facilitator superfamily transporter [Colletotrichum lupini]UQC90789.1 major facilitator superfamily transporter [Colletotrichum lupini]